MRQGRPSDRELDRLERMLERCIEEDKAFRRGKRKDPFYEKLRILRESQKKWAEENGLRFTGDDDQTKH